MEYFIYLSVEGSSVPHLEPIFADSLDEAKIIALRLMKTHSRATHADIFTFDGLVAVVTAEGSPPP